MQQVRVKNCFIKNAHKISMNFPDFILLQQTGKDNNVRFSHVTRLSKLSTRERTGWIKKSKPNSDEHFLKKLIGILGFYTAGQLKN